MRNGGNFGSRIKAKKPTIAGLVVSIYQPSKMIPSGMPQDGFVYRSGIATAFVQLGVAAVPWACSATEARPSSNR